LLQSGTIELVDEFDRTWIQEIEVASPPWTTFPIGYYMGTWKNGGNIHTFHGGDGPYLEWDEIDFSRQPADHTNYNGRTYTAIYGAEYLLRVRTQGPEGESIGMGHLEFFMHRGYERYLDQTAAN
jgi:hypothetical protein